MKQRTSAQKCAFFYSLSALIPLALMLVVLYVLKIAPFGEDTLIFLDAESQYLKFMAYLRSIFAGENDFLYTFSKTMGGDMISLAAYYLLSPFNILFALFSAEDLPLAFTVVILLKISASGLSYYHAASRRYGNSAVHLAFSTAYALMAYNVVYCWNIMWLDGVILLPLMSLGLEELWNRGKWKLYAATIAFGLITNFYIGYMLCMASVLFCLVLMALKAGTIREKLPVMGRYTAASCIGGFAAAPVWLSAILSLLGGRAGTQSQALDFAHTYGFSGLPAKFVSGTLSWEEVTIGQPNVFCGTAVLLLVGIFFISRKTPRKGKLAAAAVIAVFLASFRVELLDIIWHGFSPNRAFNYRYSFMFSFVLIRIGQHTLRNGLGITARTVAGSCMAVAAVFSYVLYCSGVGVGILSNGLALVICGILLLVWHRGKTGWLSVVFTVVCILEMGLSVHLNWQTMTRELGHLRQQSHVESLQSLEPALDYIRETDDGFYRIEQSYQSAQNLPMMLQYPGLSHFSSAEKPEVMTFLEKMGLKNCYGIWSCYNFGSTAGTDALLGVRKIMSPQPLNHIKGYPLVEQINGVSIYDNPNALPIAMLAEDTVRQVSMEGDDYFALHNALWSGIRGEQIEVVQKEENVQVSFANLQELYADPVSTYYEKTEEGAPASVRFEVTISQEKPLYAYFTSQVDDQDVFISVNGVDRGIYFNAYRWDMFYLGTYSPGEIVTVEMHVSKNELDFGQGYFYYEDLENLSQVSDTIRQMPVTLEKQSGSRLSGNFTAEEDKLLLFTIPYDAGWKVKVDGKSAAAEVVLDCLLAVPVTAGTHSFELRFIPEGTAAGCVLLITALLWTGYLTVPHEKKNIRKQNQSVR